MMRFLITFFKGYWLGLPITLGYFPVAVSFGIITIDLGFDIWVAILCSSIMFSGAGQFVFVSMLASGANIFAVIITTLIMAARHVIYGSLLRSKLPKRHAIRNIIPAHGLTDEVFALSLKKLENYPQNERWSLFTGQGFAAFSSWNVGTVLGALYGKDIFSQSEFATNCLKFALPALFITLIIPVIQKKHLACCTVMIILMVISYYYNISSVGLLFSLIISAYIHFKIIEKASILEPRK